MTGSGSVKMAAVCGIEGGVWTSSPGFDVSVGIPACQLETRPYHGGTNDFALLITCYNVKLTLCRILMDSCNSCEN